MYAPPNACVCASYDRLVVSRHPELEFGLELELVTVELSGGHYIITRELL